LPCASKCIRTIMNNSVKTKHNRRVLNVFFRKLTNSDDSFYQNKNPGNILHLTTVPKKMVNCERFKKQQKASVQQTDNYHFSCFEKNAVKVFSHTIYHFIIQMTIFLTNIRLSRVQEEHVLASGRFSYRDLDMYPHDLETRW